MSSWNRMAAGAWSAGAWVALSWLTSLPAAAEWTAAGPGIAYRQFAAPGPNDVFVARMDRSHPDVFIDSVIAGGRWNAGRETVSAMAARHEDALTCWGQVWGTRSDVVVAVNGDFFNLTTGIPASGQIQSGWYARRFVDFTGGSGFVWPLNRQAFIGGCIHHRGAKNKIIYPATGQDQTISGINVPPAADQITIYTPHIGLSTDTGPTVTEVLVQLSEPLLIKPMPSYVSGIVREIRLNQGATVVPFDAVVLSAAGSAAVKLRNNVGIGSEVRFSQELTHYERDCETPRAGDWTKAYAAIGGSFHFLRGGAVQGTSDPGLTARHPRTAVAFNATHIFFIVVDGRSARSVGMSMAELGAFCIDALGATEGINQDGGGSSAMWVNGQIRNNPSDGSERPVANGLIMAVAGPRQTSGRFSTGQQVEVLVSTWLRTGPGTAYPGLAAAAPGTVATIQPHALAGVRAAGRFWWPCTLTAGTGWLDESTLRRLRPRHPDLDDDGDVDLDDFGILQGCVSGSGVPQPLESCFSSLLDSDDDVDLLDLHLWRSCMTGADIPFQPTHPPPGCTLP